MHRPARIVMSILGILLFAVGASSLVWQAVVSSAAASLVVAAILAGVGASLMLVTYRVTRPERDG